MIYLDNASTTKIDPRVLEAMMPYLTEQYGNPGSIHMFGEEARKAVDKAREQVAKAINADPEEIIFTSGGSEANNLAVKFARDFWGPGHKVISSLMEHDSMKKALRNYYPKQVEFFKYMKPDDLIKEVKRQDDSAFVSSFMYVNNELGFVNPVKEICDGSDAMTIVDAVQALGSEEIDVKKIGCDLMTFSSHKIHGPKGVGALYINKGLTREFFCPLIFGGDHQEFGFRGGTENVAGIVGFGKACELQNVDSNKTAILSLKKAFFDALNFDFVVHNAEETSKIISMFVQYADAETLVLMLSSKGVCVSAGSACKSLEQKPNEVLLAAGLSEYEARHTIRISLSTMNTIEEMKEAARIFNECIEVMKMVCK